MHETIANRFSELWKDPSHAVVELIFLFRFIFYYCMNHLAVVKGYKRFRVINANRFIHPIYNLIVNFIDISAYNRKIGDGSKRFSMIFLFDSSTSSGNFVWWAVSVFRRP